MQLKINVYQALRREIIDSRASVICFTIFFALIFAGCDLHAERNGGRPVHQVTEDKIGSEVWRFIDCKTNVVCYRSLVYGGYSISCLPLQRIAPSTDKKEQMPRLD